MESPFKLFIRDGEEPVEIPRALLKYFGFFQTAHKDSEYDEFSEHVDFPLDRQLWTFILSVYVKHDDLYGDDEPLEKAIDDNEVDKTLSFLDLKMLYTLTRTFDFYEMPLFMMVVIREVMRRLLCMTTGQLYLTHREMKRLNESCTTVIETVVGDCARQSTILEILRNYVGISYLVDMIHDRFLPRIAPLLAAGEGFSLVLTKRGVFSVGSNSNGQIARPAKANETSFQRVTLDDVVSVAASRSCSFFITRCGALYSAGSNLDSQLGYATMEDHTFKPERVNIEFVTAVSPGDTHTVALTADGVYTWGKNPYGQLGNGTRIKQTTPMRLTIDAPIMEIGANESYSAMLSESGDLYVCGLALYLSPTKIELPTPVKKMVCLRYHIVLLMNDDTLYVWCDTTALAIPMARTGIKELAPLVIPDFIVKPGTLLGGWDTFYLLSENGNLHRLVFNGPTNLIVNSGLFIRNTVTDVIEIANHSSHTLILKRDGLYGIGLDTPLGNVTMNGTTTTPVLLPLVVGHEEFADTLSDAKKRKIDKSNLSCHVCGSVDLASLQVHTASNKLFCDYTCLNAYTKPRF